MKLHGIIPPMTTPFDAQGEIEFKHIRPQVDWLVGQGAHGLAVGGSTGEGHTLDASELKDLIDATVAAVKGRVPVVAGIISDSTRDVVRRGRLVAKSGVAALQITPVHYLFRPHDDAMLQHFKTVAEETGVPVLIYNVVPWAYLSPQLLTRIMNEVPGVIGVKQSAGDMKLFADLMITANPRNLIFSAVDALLYGSFTLGAHGAIAAILTAAPRACVELWNATAAGQHARARSPRAAAAAVECDGFGQSAGLHEIRARPAGRRRGVSARADAGAERGAARGDRQGARRLGRARAIVQRRLKTARIRSGETTC